MQRCHLLKPHFLKMYDLPDCNNVRLDPVTPQAQIPFLKAVMWDDLGSNPKSTTYCLSDPSQVFFTSFENAGIQHWGYLWGLNKLMPIDIFNSVPGSQYLCFVSTYVIFSTEELFWQIFFHGINRVAICSQTSLFIVKLTLLSFCIYHII